MSSVLITGATGFLGRACLPYLQRTGLTIHAMYHQRPLIEMNGIHWHHCDLLNSKSVARIISELKPTYLIHLAWFVEHGKFWHSEQNVSFVVATLNLYQQFSLHNGKKAIFVGSCAEYDQSHSICHEQTTPLNPNTLYGMMKKNTLLDLLNSQQAEDGAPLSWIRLFNVFGLHEHPERLIPYLFLSYLSDKTPILEKPLSIRDYFFIENLGQIFVSLLQRNCTEIINLGSGNQLSLEQLAAVIQQQFFHDKVTAISNYEHTADCLAPNLDYFHSLNIPVSYTLEQGLEQVYCYWSTIREKYEISC